MENSPNYCERISHSGFKKMREKERFIYLFLLPPQLASKMGKNLNVWPEFSLVVGKARRGVCVLRSREETLVYGSGVTVCTETDAFCKEQGK